MRWLLAAVMIVLIGIGCDKVDGMTAPQESVDAIANALSQNTIQRIEIVQIPPTVATRAQISPKILERQYHFKLTIQDVLNSTHRDRLSKAVKSTVAQARTETADLRWGIIFYSRSDVRVGALYFDRSGRYGAVNEAPASFSGDLFAWLNSTFSHCFQ